MNRKVLFDSCLVGPSCSLLEHGIFKQILLKIQDSVEMNLSSHGIFNADFTSHFLLNLLVK